MRPKKESCTRVHKRWSLSLTATVVSVRSREYGSESLHHGLPDYNVGHSTLDLSSCWEEMETQLSDTASHFLTWLDVAVNFNHFKLMQIYSGKLEAPQFTYTFQQNICASKEQNCISAGPPRSKNKNQL